MLSVVCKDCRECIWMVGIGQGVRCHHEDNQQYKKDTDNDLPVIISRIPEECMYYNKRGNNGN